MTKNITKIIRSDEEQNRAIEMYDKLRVDLLKRDLSNSENYDKSILTLSTASLGVSLTAIRFIVPLETAKFIYVLKLGWVLLLIGIITSLAAFLVSNKAIETQLKNAEYYYIHGIADAFDIENIFKKINTALNYGTGVIFIVAITIIILFVLFNI